jgi:hypothetical protein
VGTDSVDVQSSLSETSSSVVKNDRAPAIMTAHHIAYTTLLLERK